MFRRYGFDRWIWLTLIAITIVFMIPLIGQGIPSGHDLIYHFSRIVGSFDLLKRGEFPVRMLPGFYYNLGYPVGVFYPMGILYLASGLMTIGLDFVLSYKVLIITITFLTSISMYFASFGILKHRNAALLSTVVLVFSIYRGLVDLYIRAAIGEYIAFIFIPLAFYGIFRILFENDRKGFLLAFAMLGLLTSHTLSTLMVVLLFVIMLMFEVKRLLKDKTIIVTLIKAVIIVLLIGAYYWLPMLEMMFSDTFQFSFPWTNLVENTLDSLSQVLFISMKQGKFPFGYEVWNLLIIFIILITLSKKILYDRFIRIIVMLFILSFIVVSNIIPVEYLTFLNFIQFPWRLLIFISIFGAWIIGYGYSKSPFSYNVYVLIPSFLFLMTMYVASTSYYFNVEMKDYKYQAFPRFSIEHAYAEFLPENIDMDYLISIRKQEGVLLSSPIEIEYSQDLLNFYVYFNQAEKENTTIEFPIIYYKGYAAYYVNDEQSGFLDVNKSINGLVEVNLGSTDYGNIKIFYNGTRIQKYSMYGSIVSLVIVVFLMLKK